MDRLFNKTGVIFAETCKKHLLSLVLIECLVGRAELMGIAIHLLERRVSTVQRTFHLLGTNAKSDDTVAGRNDDIDELIQAS